ncbi:Cation transport regulator chaB, partial [Salmonella enterica subsp. enterica serovar Rissen]
CRIKPKVIYPIMCGMFFQPMPRTFTKKRLIAPGSNIKIKPIVVMTPAARKPHIKSPGRRLKTIMKKARMINGIRKN